MGDMEKTFFDVRVTHPNAPSYYGMTEERLHELNEKEKNDGYLERCLQSEKSGFIPLVYSTTDGIGPACEAYHKRLAILMAGGSKKKRQLPCYNRSYQNKGQIHCPQKHCDGHQRIQKEVNKVHSNTNKSAFF